MRKNFRSMGGGDKQETQDSVRINRQGLIEASSMQPACKHVHSKEQTTVVDRQ